MKIVDTNILLRAALEDDQKQSLIAKRFLAEADVIVVPTYALCEFVWVMARSYKLRSEKIIFSVIQLMNSDKVVLDTEAVTAGLDFLVRGGDFADGVIEYEGRKLGGEVFVTFDRRAADVAGAQGREILLLDPA